MLPGIALPFPFLLLSLLIPVIAGIIILLSLLVGKPLGRKGSGIIASIALAISFITLLYVLSIVLTLGQPVYEEHYWFSIGTVIVEFSLLADFLSLPLSLAIVGLCTASAVYSIEYIKDKHDFAMYYVLLLLFAVGMLGVTLATNLLVFFIFFEGMNIPAYFLVSNWGTKKAKIIGVKYILYVFIGAICILAAIFWVFGITSALGTPTLNIYEIPALLSPLASTSLLIMQSLALLFSIGFFVKMAIFPLHSWLPDFHGEAPVPIHALLSAVMIKTGAYGFIRITYFFFPLVVLQASILLAVLAIFTMIWGAGMALVQTDYKRVLAYSSVNQIGYILLGFSTMNIFGITGALFHILTHGLSKGVLLYTAGSVVHSAGTKLINKMGGLASKMPLTATLSTIGALAIAGTPPLATFVSEALIFIGVFTVGVNYPIFTVIGVIGIISTALTAAYYLWTVRRMFLGPPSTEMGKTYEEYLAGRYISPEGIPRRFEDVHESPPLMTIPMLIVALLIILLGVFAGFILPIIYPAAESVIAILIAAIGGL
ncbi:MAG: NuoM family protein [Promethearchaeota archaeon]